MTIDSNVLRRSIADDLSRITDARVVVQITSMLVEPYLEMRLWDYGPIDRYPCWIVLKDETTKTAIAYAEQGFKNMWGILWIGDLDAPEASMGMDSGWFLSFAEAYYDSGIPTSLPIWQVFERVPFENYPGSAITVEGSWQEMWDRVTSLQERYPERRFTVGHSTLRGVD